MRTRYLDIPVEIIQDVCEYIGQHELTNEIENVSSDGDIIIKIDYAPSEAKLIERLYAMIDRYHDEHEQDMDDDDDDEEEDEDADPDSHDDDDNDDTDDQDSPRRSDRSW